MEAQVNSEILHTFLTDEERKSIYDKWLNTQGVSIEQIIYLTEEAIFSKLERDAEKDLTT